MFYRAAHTRAFVIIMTLLVGRFGQLNAQDNFIDQDTIITTSPENSHKYLEFSEKKNWVYLPLPFVSYSPETSAAFGLLNQVIYQRKGDTTSTSSNVKLTGYYTLNKQYEVEVEWNGYFAGDDLIFHLNMEHSDFISKFYGIGNDTENTPQTNFQGKSLEVIGEAGFRVNDVLWIGPSVDFTGYFSNDFTNDSTFDASGLIGKEKAFNTGVGGFLRYDTRDNKLYSRKGIYFGLSANIYPKFFGSSTNNFSLTADYRQFISPGKGKQTIGWQAQLHSRYGNLPFQVLATIGGKKSMRGYYKGRYRDQHSAFLQMEYRFPFWSKGGLHGAAFLGIAEVFSKPSDITVSELKATIGGGIRYMLDKKSRTTIRFDYGRTREGDNGFYLTVSEAF